MKEFYKAMWAKSPALVIITAVVLIGLGFALSLLKPPVGTRDPNAFYQNGKVMAKVDAVHVDVTDPKKISLWALYANDQLDFSKTFEYQDLRLKCQYDSAGMNAARQLAYWKVSCDVLEKI